LSCFKDIQSIDIENPCGVGPPRGMAQIRKGQSMHHIYLVRRDSKPVYVGYTSRTLDKRWQEHICISNNPKFPLHHAIKKHGIDSFTIEMLYESEDELHTLNYMEHHYIWLYRTYKSLGGYNVTIGGEGWSKGLSKKERNDREKARKRAWRKANKAYFQENKDIINARQRDWRKANKDRINAQKKAWREAKKRS
jgi:group I intron endonuclease